MTKRPLLTLSLAILILLPRTAGATARLLDFVEETPALHFGNPVHSIVSPDGAYVYVADYYDFTVSIFARDAGTGTLRWIDRVVNGVGGVTGLQPSLMALSPDGAHLYVSSYYNGTVNVFSRDAGTGALTWVETQHGGAGGVSYLTYPYELGVSPDGAHLYVATSYPGAVLLFDRNATTGALTFVEAKVDGAPDGLNGATLLAISPDGANVYVGSFEDVVVVFSRDAGTGVLTHVETEATYVSGINISPDGAHVYVRQTNLVSIYNRDSLTGALTYEDVVVDGVGGVTALYGIRDVEITPDGAHVYVVSDYDDGLVVFSRNAGTGHLTLVEEKRDGVGNVVGLRSPTSIAASPDGASLYVTTSSDYYYYPAAVTAWSRNAGTGTLTELQHLSSDVKPVALALSPDGAHLYGAEGDRVSIYARDGGTGALTRAGSVADFGAVDGLSYVRALVVSPDGAHLYATGQNDNAVSAFARNAGTGALTFIELQRDGVAGVDGLAGARDLAMSADGAYLYVTGPNDSAVAVFARNAGTGALTETQVVQQGVGGVVGVSYAKTLALAPDGAHLYVAGPDGVATFGRNAGTGALTFIGALSMSDVSPDYYYSYFERGVSITPDGAFVYVSLADRDAFRVFSRNASTGALTEVGVIPRKDAGYYAGANTHLAFTADGGAAYLPGITLARHPDNGLFALVQLYANGQYADSAVLVGPLGEVYSSSASSVQRHAPGFAGCDGGPLPICRAASGGQVVLGSTSPSITWSWIGADQIMPGDFGDPLYSESYALCMWDESGPTPTLILRSFVPAGQLCSRNKTCWKATATGFSYRDPVRSPEGAASIRLKAGAANQSRLTAVAKRELLPFPGLPLAVPIRIQLQTSSGECFGATYSSPGANDSRSFGARPD